MKKIEKYMFPILCGIGSAWLAVFVAMLLGARLSPRIQMAIATVWVIWFAFWTIVSLKECFGKKSEPSSVPPTANTDVPKETSVGEQTNK